MKTKRTAAEVVAVESLLRSLREARSLFPRTRPKAAVSQDTANQTVWAAHQLYKPHEAEELLQYGRRGSKEIASCLAEHLAILQKLGPWRKLAPAPAADSLTKLEERFPNFGEVIRDIERHLALARLAPAPTLRLPPILLLGDPGLGKTRFCQELAAVMQTPYFELPLNSTSAGFVIAGLDLSWSSARPGQVYSLLAESKFSNPLFVLDELDKANGNEKFDILGPLLTLLEPTTARRFKDEAVPIPLDVSQVIWIATANDLALVSEPLRTRFLIHTIHVPTGAQSVRVIESIYMDLRNSQPWGKHFDPKLDTAVIHALSGRPPRMIARALLDTAGAAALCGRRRIELCDVRIESSKTRKIGFTNCN